ncbi:MAG: EAL domain-containing protein [Solirubrobacteraceae bacterium MAG38_C4-C5]|nr:EAL domain-containing protein [Candidatus Siliceabacter maunaloa]
MPSWSQLSPEPHAVVATDAGADILHRRFVEASRRAEIVALVNEAAGEAELCEVVSREICQALEAEVAFVLVVRPGGEPRVAGAVGLSDAQRAALVGQGPCAAALDRHAAAVHTGVRATTEVPPELAELGLGVLAVAPFAAQEGRTLLAVGRLAETLFDGPELALMDAVATSTGHALRRAWLADDSQAAEERSALMGLITATMAEGVCLLDPGAGSILYANPALERMLGYGAGELDGRSVHLLGGLPPDGDWSGEVPCVTRAGTPVWCRANVSTFEHSEHGTLWVIVLADITERRLHEAELERLVNREPLTGLLNRRRFEEELAAHIDRAQRYGAPAALLALDLDNFKSVNDSLGHSAGDQLIVRVADLLRRRLRHGDVVARVGGDEFAVLLPEASAADARRVADALLSTLRCEAGAGLPRRVTASIGVALVEAHTKASAQDVLMAADIAMYDAKEEGRDQVAVYDHRRTRHTSMEDRLDWAERIRRALDEGRFVLHAQPVLALNGDDEGPRYELLVRMEETDGTLVEPGSFLAIAERFGLVPDIDCLVVRRAIALLAAQQRAGRPDISLAVNLSARSVVDPRMAAVIERELARTGADPRGLVLEITETAAIDNLEHAQRFAARVGALGCELALDDFGAGFASFASLKHLDFDLVKIDGEFIVDLAGDRTNQLVVRAVADMARELGKRTVAEFVGDERTLAMLREYGIDYAQGYHVGRPVPLEEVGLAEASAHAAACV